MMTDLDVFEIDNMYDIPNSVVLEFHSTQGWTVYFKKNNNTI